MRVVAGSCEKESDSEYVLTVELTRVSAGLDIGYERQAGVRDDSKLLGLSNWKNSVSNE